MLQSFLSFNRFPIVDFTLSKLCRYPVSGRGYKKTMMSALTIQHLSHMFCSCVSFADFSDFKNKVNHPSEADNLKRVLFLLLRFPLLDFARACNTLKKSVSYGFWRVMFLFL